MQEGSFNSFGFWVQGFRLCEVRSGGSVISTPPPPLPPSRVKPAKARSHVRRRREHWPGHTGTRLQLRQQHDVPDDLWRPCCSCVFNEDFQALGFPRLTLLQGDLLNAWGCITWHHKSKVERVLALRRHRPMLCILTTPGRKTLKQQITLNSISAASSCPLAEPQSSSRFAVVLRHPASLRNRSLDALRLWVWLGSLMRPPPRVQTRGGVTPDARRLARR